MADVDDGHAYVRCMNEDELADDAATRKAGE